MPKLDLASIPSVARSGYPAVFQHIVQGRSTQRLGAAAGLTQFGVNICHLAPGAASSIRHWHANEDEFALMLTGELVLVEDEGETVMRPGDCAGFKAGVANGHNFINRSTNPASFLIIGSRLPRELAHYPDHDLAYELTETGERFLHKDGTPY